VTVFSERPLPNLGRDGSVLPEGWAEIALEEIVIHAIGGEWGEAAEKPGLVEVSVIRGTEFREWARDRGSTAAVRFIPRSRLAQRQLRAGDIVVEISGGGPDQPVGRTLLIDGEALGHSARPLVCSNFCRLMRLHEAVDPAFVRVALQEKYLRGEVSDYQTQTTNLRNLDFKDFLSGTLLRLPPLGEQKRIAARAEELLAAVGEARGKLARVRAIVKKFRQAVLADATSGRLTEEWRARRGEPERFAVFSEPSAWLAPEPLAVPEVPEGWSLVALRDVVRAVQYGTSVRAVKNLKNGVPSLRMGNIRDGAIDLSDLKSIDPRATDVRPFLLRRGDILFNRTNSPELVGKAAVFDHDLEAVFASYLVRIACDERLVSSRYVCAWINSPWGRQWARTVRTDCVSQSNINASKLASMPLPVPPLAEQGEIVRRMGELFHLADAIERRLAAAWAQVERLPRTILERALRGELVPTEAELAHYEGREHEPASLLVERVRAERAAERRPRLEALPREPLGAERGEPGESSPEEILAAFRQACWGAEAMTAGELLRRVELRLVGSRAGRPDPARLQALLATALERRIVAREGAFLVGATPKFARYDDPFLLAVMVGLLAGDREGDRRTLSRAVAAHLGYSQVTAAMRDRMEEVVEDGLRRGVLALRSGRLYAIHSNSS
jgi:type I restriction enzyme S subunit